MRVTTLFNKLLNLQGLRVTGFCFERADLVLTVDRRFNRLTCSRCGRSRTGNVQGAFRRWRHLSIWGRTVWIEGLIRRFRCGPCQKLVTESVP